MISEREMSDNAALDEAIMREAVHRAMIGGDGNTEKVILIAIKLAREGWTPPKPVDPFLLVARKLAASSSITEVERMEILDGHRDEHRRVRSRLSVLKRGAELEREQVVNWLDCVGVRQHHLDELCKGDHWKEQS